MSNTGSWLGQIIQNISYVVSGVVYRVVWCGVN